MKYKWEFPQIELVEDIVPNTNFYEEHAKWCDLWMSSWHECDCGVSLSAEEYHDLQRHVEMRRFDRIMSGITS